MAARQLIVDALAFEQAGAGAVVIEAVPAAPAATITAELQIPTLGIGAGLDCSGQLLVMHDMPGTYPGKRPRFAQDFIGAGSTVYGAVNTYVRAVKTAAFPCDEYSF